MRNFFMVVFGGGVAVVAGFAMAYSIGHIMDAFNTPHVSASARIDLQSSGAIGSIQVQSVLASESRLTAAEEEDALSAAEDILPHTDVKNVTAQAYMVTNLSHSSVSYASPVLSHNPDKLLPIASLSKLVTAVVAKKLISPDKKITISKDIMATYGNTAGFKIGETFTAGDLMYPLLMVSSNDAAEAFAQSYGRAAFIKAMNDFTQSIGAYRTSFEDPSGLSPHNVSTARDLTLILDWVRRNQPDLIAITLLKTKTLRSHTWMNPTHFLSMSNYAGGKNGYIPEANRTSASLFTLGTNNNLYAVILLGSNSRDADEIKLLKQVK